MELLDNVFVTVKKVKSIETYMAGLDAKINVKVSGLDSKPDAMLNSFFEATKSRTTIAKREA